MEGLGGADVARMVAELSKARSLPPLTSLPPYFVAPGPVTSPLGLWLALRHAPCCAALSPRPHLPASRQELGLERGLPPSAMLDANAVASRPI